MARAGMANLISRLRVMTAAGTADHSVAGTSYFTDDQLQDRLDTSQVYWQNIPFEAKPEYQAGATVYFDYVMPLAVPRVFEEEASASGWAVRDSAGGTVGGYTANYETGRITFATNTAGSAYYWYGRTYDLEKTAAKVWREKAAFAANNVDWQSDNHRISASQEYEHCIKMAEQFEKAGGGVSVAKLWRTDVNP